MSTVPSTRRAERASKVALFLLWASFAAVAFNIYSEVRELQLIDDLERLEASGNDDDSEAMNARIEANDARQARAMLGYLAAVGLSWIVMLVWVSRCNRACRDLGAKNMRFTPGWAWGYWLVPFVNLVRPYQIVRELWTSSTTEPDGPSAPLIGWWWAMWLASGFLSNFSVRGLDDTSSLAELRQADQLLLASHALDAIAFALTIALVGRLTARLRQHHDAVTPAGVRVVSEAAESAAAESTAAKTS